MSASPRWWIIPALIFALAVGACAGGNGDPVSPPVATKASGTSLFGDDQQASFRLARMVFALNRGDVIAHYPRYLTIGGSGCRCNDGYGENATLE